MPDRWARRISLTASVAVAAFCAAGVAADGPLTAAMGVGICMPSPGGEPVAIGDQPRNEGPATVTITHLALRDPVGVTLEGAYLIPIVVEADGTHLGFGTASYPLSFDPVDGVPEFEEAWSERVEAVGGHIAPGETVSLVVAVRPAPGTSTATFDGFEIAYTEAGRSHRITSAMDITIRSGAAACF